MENIFNDGAELGLQEELAGPLYIAQAAGPFIRDDGLIAGGAWACIFHLGQQEPLLGIVRVTSDNDGRPDISGDLYQSDDLTSITDVAPEKLRIENWRNYLKCVQYWDPTTQGKIILEWRFRAVIGGQYQDSDTWRTIMSPVNLNGQNFVEEFSGSIFRGPGEPIVGDWRMVRISRYVRSVSVEILTAQGCPAPPDSSQSPRWGEAFAGVGWKVNASHRVESLPAVTGAWSLAELHAAMLAARIGGVPDSNWVARLLVVPRLQDTERGIMFDSDSADTNNIPREGAAVAANWTVPATPNWGRSSPLFHQNTDLFLRTIIHELGHVFNLDHDSTDDGIMCTTDELALRGTAARPATVIAAENFHFSAKTRRELMHWTDRLVRPGDWPFAHVGGEDHMYSGFTPRELEFTAAPVDDILPIGAPVRIQLKLRNAGKVAATIPTSIGMKGGCLSGTVTNAAGKVANFSPVFLCMDGCKTKFLPARRSLKDAATLWSGRDGPLFSCSGFHRLDFILRWRSGLGHVSLRSSCSIMVTGAVTRDHAAAALELFRSPDILLLLAIGGDHHRDTDEAMSRALKCPVLRPHWTYTQINRLARKHFGRSPDWDAVSILVIEQKPIATNSKESSKLGKWRKMSRPD